jgi:hypothetical protein
MGGERGWGVCGGGGGIGGVGGIGTLKIEELEL